MSKHQMTLDYFIKLALSDPMPSTGNVKRSEVERHAWWYGDSIAILTVEYPEGLPGGEPVWKCSVSVPADVGGAERAVRMKWGRTYVKDVLRNVGIGNITFDSALHVISATRKMASSELDAVGPDVPRNEEAPVEGAAEPKQD